MKPDLIEIQNPAQIDSVIVDNDVVKLIEAKDERVFTLSEPVKVETDDELVDFEIALRKGKRVGFLVG